MSDFVESDHNRNRESGRFEDKAGTKPGAPLASAALEHRIGGATIPDAWLETLPEWPAGLESPTVGWQDGESGVEAFAQFGERIVTCWDAPFDGSSIDWSGDDGAGLDDETREAVEDYVRVLRLRADYVVESIRGVATAPLHDEIDAIIAGRDPRAVHDRFTAPQRAEIRANRALNAWVAIPSAHDRLNSPDAAREETATAVQDVLTDLMHWADMHEIDLDALIERARHMHDDEVSDPL